MNCIDHLQSKIIFDEKEQFNGKLPNPFKCYNCGENMKRVDYTDLTQYIIFRYFLDQDRENRTYHLYDCIQHANILTNPNITIIKEEMRKRERAWQHELGRSYQVLKTYCPVCGTYAEYDALNIVDQYKGPFPEGTFLYCKSLDCTAIQWWHYQWWVDEQKSWLDEEREDLVDPFSISNEDLPF